MDNKYCQRCGSRDLIADRSLGGRIVCAICGSTLIASDNLLGLKKILNFNSKKLFFVLFAFMLIVILIS